MNTKQDKIPVELHSYRLSETGRARAEHNDARAKYAAVVEAARALAREDRDPACGCAQHERIEALNDAIVALDKAPGSLPS